MDVKHSQSHNYGQGICEWCQAPFTKTKTTQRYDKNTCYQKAKYARESAKAAAFGMSRLDYKLLLSDTARVKKEDDSPLWPVPEREALKYPHTLLRFKP